MDTVPTLVVPPAIGLPPFSLKDTPALIERVFPAQKIGIEAQKERKAGAGQTLTALGSYWKGRKPLVLVRATILACLLPATDDPEGDLALFETLMRMDDEGLLRRKPKVTIGHVMDCTSIPILDKIGHTPRAKPRHDEANEEENKVSETRERWGKIDLSHIADPATRREERARIEGAREALRCRAFLAMRFSQQVAICERVEQVENLHDANDPLYAGIWEKVNDRLGTTARTLPELIEQLGIARFGHRPVIGDPFCGGGSIPFEAARVGCDAVASDLNPIAAMLTWGALNIIGADDATREHIRSEQQRVASLVDEEITRLGIEHDATGNRAKAYLYCLETVDPRTGWRVPLAPSWVISRNRRCVAKLVPDHAFKRFDIVIEEGASTDDITAAERGTLRDGEMVYRIASTPDGDEQEWRISIGRLRGDGEGAELPGGGRGNLLRPWDVTDVAPREPEWAADASPVLPGSAPGAWVGGDIWLERLYCVQWMAVEDIEAGKSRPRTFFSAPKPEDFLREVEIRRLVEENLVDWQVRGFVPDMAIETGSETARLLRERGWMYWHHLYNPRHLLMVSLFKKECTQEALLLCLCSLLNRVSRLTQWHLGHGGRDGSAPSADQVDHVFYNNALNVFYNYASRSWPALMSFVTDEFPQCTLTRSTHVVCGPVTSQEGAADLQVFDPPYADAIQYHEITEFFISWLTKNLPPQFEKWTWDSRRPLAIQGKGEKFRTDMVVAFKAMANRLPDNGLQVCMFTHQDAGVWADMAQIVWGAGLRVTAAWYVSTETTSELKKGGYVQGTVLLVLRKRQGDERAYKDELVLEIRSAVERQVELLTGLNQRAKSNQRDENPFSDADMQMAGYAAALEVLTGYTHIEGIDMTREVLRPRVKGERGIVEEMIDLAVQTATEMMRPTGIGEALWERLAPSERFYLKMTEAEASRPIGMVGGKLDDYQNFAKAYRADGWADLMADSTPNKARLKNAAEFRRSLMTGHKFAGGLVRPVLYAINELRLAAEKEEDPNVSGMKALSGLRDNLTSWSQQRQNAMTIAEWFGKTLKRHWNHEASAARTLSALIRTERLG